MYTFMARAQRIKFHNHPDERAALLDTVGPLILAETDGYWGGDAPFNAACYQDESYEGTNSLGIILQELREALRQEDTADDKAGKNAKDRQESEEDA